MKDYIRQILEGVTGDLLRTSLVREYLQARILQSFQEDGVFTHWAVLEGTALRFLYSIPRFSEELDFSVFDSSGNPRFRSALRRVQNALQGEGYDLNTRINDQKTVASAFFRFPGLLHELELSPHSSQVLSIKVELDTKPPVGAGVETTIVRRHVMLHLQHHDRSSLLAGKLHALLSRPWCKGRDVYDLIWYLADRSWPGPNIPFLNAALAQTGWTGPEMTPQNWRQVLEGKLGDLDWKKARADVQPFLERAREIELVNLENMLSLLKP